MHKHKYIKILNIYMLLYLCKSDSPIKKKKFVLPHQKSWFRPCTGGRRSCTDRRKERGEGGAENFGGKNLENARRRLLVSFDIYIFFFLLVNALF